MKYIRKNNDIILRLDLDEEIISEIIELANKENIKSASITGIGATKSVTVGIFDPSDGSYQKETYEGIHEITSLVGNLTRKDNKPYLHLHLNAANSKHEVVGGHLNEAVIGVTAEIFIHVIDIDINRKFDEKVLINVLDF